MSSEDGKVTSVGTRFALTVTKANGFPQSEPSTYREFLKFSSASPNSTGYVPHSFAWRGRNRPTPFNCRMAFARADEDFIPFEPKLLDGSDSVLTTQVFGAARRRTMLWGKKILSTSAQMVFSAPQPNKMPWSHFTRNSIAELKKYPEVEREIIPSAQLRLLSGMQASARGGITHDELGRMLDIQSLFAGLRFTAPANKAKVQRGSRVSETSVWSACFLIGGNQKRKRDDRWGDEWRAWPVLTPPMPYVTNADQSHAVTNSPNLQHGGLLDLGLVVERIGYQLNDAAITRFTRALEHFSAHVAQLQSLRRLVNHWWEPLLDPPTWSDKQIAAGNFLRAWQQHSLHVAPLWALGANDPQADPTIINALDSAIGLRSAWAIECSRMSDLVQLSTQILSDGDPSIHLNNNG
ncbi:MAG: hypothetical protein AAF996_04795 [Pseudomonadota bacterium]